MGGTVSADGAWPGAAAVYKSGSLACGGTLVAPSWVITAAHCVTTSSPTGGFSSVIVGRNKLSGTGGETHAVDKAFRHPQYDASHNDNDIALIHLAQPSSQKVAKVIRTSQVAGALATGVLTTVIGWGTTSEGGDISDSLREVQVPVIDQAKCKASSGYSTLAANSVCAAYPQGGKDSCQGDSGGGLFQAIGGEWLEVGLVSWGIGCAQAGAPGVYTRVGNYISWLKQSSNGEIDPDSVPVTPDTGASSSSSSGSSGSTTSSSGSTTSSSGSTTSSSGSTTSSSGSTGTCAHSVCSAGSKLTATCDACAQRVCAGDSFCCSHSWDSTCVGEAASVCGECQ